MRVCQVALLVSCAVRAAGTGSGSYGTGTGSGTGSGTGTGSGSAPSSPSSTTPVPLTTMSTTVQSCGELTTCQQQTTGCLVCLNAIANAAPAGHSGQPHQPEHHQHPGNATARRAHAQRVIQAVNNTACQSNATLLMAAVNQAVSTECASSVHVTAGRVGPCDAALVSCLFDRTCNACLVTMYGPGTTTTTNATSPQCSLVPSTLLDPVVSECVNQPSFPSGSGSGTGTGSGSGTGSGAYSTSTASSTPMPTKPHHHADTAPSGLKQNTKIVIGIFGGFVAFMIVCFLIVKYRKHAQKRGAMAFMSLDHDPTMAFGDDETSNGHAVATRNAVLELRAPSTEGQGSINAASPPGRRSSVYEDEEGSGLP
eukprot:m.184345 g.184345  ORF g.184345 m.184345 type:complete len:368 (-) comp16119_c0_seq1:86-1189(-)